MRPDPKSHTEAGTGTNADPLACVPGENEPMLPVADPWPTKAPTRSGDLVKDWSEIGSTLES